MLLLAVPLLLGLAVVGAAGVIAAAFLLLPDPKVRTAQRRRADRPSPGVARPERGRPGRRQLG